VSGDDRVDEGAAVRRPWLPGCLSAPPHRLTTADVGELSYLVVEEMVEDVTVVTVSPWPAADAYGRLRFDGAAEAAEVAILTAALYRELYRGRISRRPRVGDVFAARVDRDALSAAPDGVWAQPLARLLPGPVYDLSAEARKVAKLAVYAVRSDIVDIDEAEANLLLTKAEQNRPANALGRLDEADHEGQA
jgi:hypothetical protein